VTEQAVDLEVRGPNVRLRIPRAADAHRLFELASDPEVTRFFSWGPYQEETEAEAWLATLPARRESGVALELAVVDPDDWVVGVVAVLEQSKRDRRAIMGVWIGQAYWGTGVNAEAQSLLAHLVFEEMRMERWGAWVDLRNPRSQRSLERLGFVREGVLRGWHRHGDERRDLISYALLRDDWLDSSMSAIRADVRGFVPEAFVCAER
jgi:ribosomal-protein-alanine N-acetyltransferase